MRLIDADALKAKLEKIADMNNPKWSYDSMMIAKIMIGILDEAPTVEERKEGHWLKKHNVSDTSEFTAICCSSCGYEVNFFWNDWQNSKYCPNCGAIMDGDK